MLTQSVPIYSAYNSCHVITTNPEGGGDTSAAELLSALHNVLHEQYSILSKYFHLHSLWTEIKTKVYQIKQTDSTSDLQCHICKV